MRGRLLMWLANSSPMAGGPETVGDRAGSGRRRGATRRPIAARNARRSVTLCPRPCVPAVGDQTAPLIPLQIEAGSFYGNVRHRAGRGDGYLIHKHLEESRQLLARVEGIDSDLFDELFKSVRRGRHRKGRVFSPDSSSGVAGDLHAHISGRERGPQASGIRQVRTLRYPLPQRPRRAWSRMRRGRSGTPSPTTHLPGELHQGSAARSGRGTRPSPQ